MKKRIVTGILAFLWLAAALCPAEIRNYSHSFFGVYGKRAMVMGTADGSAFEVWVYPYKVLHDLQFQVLVAGAEENPYQRLGDFRFSPLCFEREFIGEKWKISEQLYPADEQPGVFLVYRINALQDIVLEFSFKPDLSPMWPASVGGKFSYWDEEGGYYVLSESGWKNHALFGGFPGQKVGVLPAHKLPGGRLRYRIAIPKGSHEIPLLACAGRGKFEDTEKIFKDLKNNRAAYFKARSAASQAFVNDHLRVSTPEPWIDEALAYCIQNVNAAFVHNPDLGEGLIAGYGLSGEGERPGFGWFFGGDGMINSFAILDYGDFAGVRRELEFLFKYQRKDGKIMHELSQGAGFIDWFGDYGFPYFHGDTTLYFAVLLDAYARRSGDTALIKTYQKKIDKVWEWLIKVDSDKDGIVETPLAGTGASETGPLRQKMKTDIFLASLSGAAWEAMGRIYSGQRQTAKARVAKTRAASAKEALDRLFWDEGQEFYAYAVKEDGTRIPEITIWPVIGMRFGVIDFKKGQRAQKKIASPELSTDWGTRFLGAQSQYYDPSSYNNGAVWPFLTGFSSLALYRYQNPFHAFSLLLANLRLIRDFDYGSATELLSGDIYRPLDESVQNQVWSSGNTVAAFVEGLLGFDGDALKKEIQLKPAIPLFWKSLKVENLRVGNGKLALDFRQEKNRLFFTFTFANLKGFSFDFSPFVPAQSIDIVLPGMKGRAFPITLAGENEQIEVTVDITGYAWPRLDKRLAYGQFSCGPIIEDLRLENGRLILDIWGKGQAFIDLFTDLALDCPQGRLEKQGEFTRLHLEFADHWQKQHLECPIK